MRDLLKDLALCESVNDKSDYGDLMKFACAALAGWPEAIKRAIAAEKQAERLLNHDIAELEKENEELRSQLNMAEVQIEDTQRDLDRLCEVAEQEAEHMRKLEAVAEAAQMFIEQCTIVECFREDNNSICDSYDDCPRSQLVTTLRALEGGEQVG